MELRQSMETISVFTKGRGLYEFSDQAARFLSAVNAQQGMLTCFIQHTSASLLIQENADPTVRFDLERFFGRLVPDGDRIFEHDAEGPDDMPSHVRAALTQTTLNVPVRHGKMMTGTWQGLYVYEHRLQGHGRKVVLHYLGS
jgi:secondary thiamine-phosphate synthase enzyme